MDLIVASAIKNSYSHESIDKTRALLMRLEEKELGYDP